jgi:hypothetical protein
VKPVAKGKSKVWVLQHHDELSVHEGETPPSTKVEKGERAKRHFGPFTTREAAQTYADNLSAKTLKARSQE